MTGSKTNAMNRKQVLEAVKALDPQDDFAWDGVDEDDRPATKEELQAARRRPGRPAGRNKVSTTIRFDKDVLASLKATGPGWQTRVNDAMRDWLKTHG